MPVGLFQAVSTILPLVNRVARRGSARARLVAAAWSRASGESGLDRLDDSRDSAQRRKSVWSKLIVTQTQPTRVAPRTSPRASRAA